MQIVTNIWRHAERNSHNFSICTIELCPFDLFVKIEYQFFKFVKNWYQFFTFVKFEYQFFTSEKNRTCSP